MALFRLLLLILLNKTPKAVTQLLPVNADAEQIFGVELQKVLQLIHHEQPYELIFLLEENSEDCMDENLPSLFKVPTIILNAEQSLYLKGNFSSELLAVVCLRTVEHLKLLSILAKNMHHMRYKRVLILNNEDYADSPSEGNLEALFRHCMQLKFLQVNVLYRDFPRTRIYYSYTQFPVFELEAQSLRSSETLTFYPDRFEDMKGKIVLTLPDQVEPRSMLYTDKMGKLRLTGYLGKVITAFAEQYNCTLGFPHGLTKGNKIYMSIMRMFTRNETIDIGTTVSTPQRELNTHEYTYPLEIANWQVMLPIEREVPIHQRLLSVFNVEILLIILVLSWLLSVVLTLHIDRKERYNCEGVSLLKLICNETIVRGMLGQSFKLQKRPTLGLRCVYVLIFVTGLFIGTIFCSNLVRLFTAPPTMEPITTFDIAMTRNLKIAVHETDVPNIIYFTSEAFWEEYQSLFTVIKSIEDFFELRRSFNTNYAFGVISSNWPPIAVQQNYFARKLFRLQPELYFTNMLLFGLPVNENSIYKDPLNRYIMNLHASGIFNHWFSNTFYDLVELGRLSFKDFSTPKYHGALRIQDFYWIWVLYIAGVTMCCFVFLFELVVFGKNKKILVKHRDFKAVNEFADSSTVT